MRSYARALRFNSVIARRINSCDSTSSAPDTYRAFDTHSNSIHHADSSSDVYSNTDPNPKSDANTNPHTYSRSREYLRPIARPLAKDGPHPGYHGYAASWA